MRLKQDLILVGLLVSGLAQDPALHVLPEIELLC
jgi:hypothetical protein